MIVLLRSVLIGLAIGLIAANVWPLLLLKLGMPAAGIFEAVFLLVYVWWAAGGGPPQRWKRVRAESFRVRALTSREWGWGLLAAVAFAVTVHAAIVVLFRFVFFPAAAFHAGYDFSFIRSNSMRWIAIIVSAASAGICEETGFRGYMQRPLEGRLGPVLAILVSSSLFMLVHLTKSWAMVGMIPIVFGAGVLLGLLAFASDTLVFCMIGHTIMDIGLFAYWWTQTAGTFSEQPISIVGLDRMFFADCAVLVGALLLTLLATAGLHRNRRGQAFS